MNIGIVGTGYMAAAHLKAYAKIPGLRIAALCNPSGRHLDGDFSHVHGSSGDKIPLRLDMSSVRAYRDPGEFFADAEIEVVDVCAPTHVHVELGLAALKAGKHLILEKPLARTSAEAWRLVSANRSASIFAMPAMCLRFWAEWDWLKQAIDKNTFGRVLDARFRRVAQAPAWGRGHFLDGAHSGGALLDLHIHDVDFIQYCFGVPRRVYASGHGKVSGAIDHVIAIYDVASGATVSAEGSWGMTEGFGFSMSYTVNFERATADYDVTRGQDALRLFEPNRPARSIQPEGTDGYVGELRYFAECVRSRSAPSVVTLEHGWSALKICEAEEESIHSRQPVEISQSTTP